MALTVTNFMLQLGEGGNDRQIINRKLNPKMFLTQFGLNLSNSVPNI